MKRGTVVLTPFPFTDLSGAKAQPATLLSTDLAIDTSHPDFPVTGLKVASIVKCDKLATVQRRILFGELGVLSPTLVGELNACLRVALGL